MNTARVDQVIQYALLLAGEEDSAFERQLGPIHLLKYVYLADLAHARDSGGTTFTGARWTFFNYGPWSPAVHERIRPALSAIHAEMLNFASEYGDKDWQRFSLRDHEALEVLGKTIPFEIRIDLRKLVHRFKSDTPGLLDHVYRTAPMLYAAPNDELDFSKERGPVKPESAPVVDGPTARRLKKLREAGRALREKHAASPAEARFTPKPPPLDEIHAAGMTWLHGLAGEPLTERTLSAEFDPSVWTSSARRGDGLS